MWCSSRNAMQQQEGDSVHLSCQRFSGHMVGHMALAGHCAWAGHRWWALDGQGGMQTSPLMVLSYPTPSQGGLLALNSPVALFLGKWRELIAQRWLTPSLSWCCGLPLLPGSSQGPLPTGWKIILAVSNGLYPIFKYLSVSCGFFQPLHRGCCFVNLDFCSPLPFQFQSGESQPSQSPANVNAPMYVFSCIVFHL